MEVIDLGNGVKYATFTTGEYRWYLNQIEHIIVKYVVFS
jgi:hypothetical protein